MEEEKRKVENLEDDGYSFWGIIVQWLVVLLIIAAIVVYTLVLLGPIIGNVFSDVICACLR